MTREDIYQALGDEANDLIFFDPADTFDPCLVGWVERQSLRVTCYDAAAIVARFMDEGLSEEEATEYFFYNIAPMWAGDRTPVLLFRPQPEPAPDAVDE